VLSAAAAGAGAGACAGTGAGSGLSADAAGAAVVVVTWTGEDSDEIESRGLCRLTSLTRGKLSSSAPAIVNPPTPSPRTAPPTAATFQFVVAMRLLLGWGDWLDEVLGRDLMDTGMTAGDEPVVKPN
jgi:hypothetical protein